MEHKTWTTTDKTAWGPGPWQDEPDKEQWPDPATGYACLLKRGGGGSLCGYVGVPAGHPWYGKHYGDIDPEVHGGLTYSDACEEGPEERTICHIPGPGEPEPLWWLGFDCGHAFDLMPEMNALYRKHGIGHAGFPQATYKTTAYVKAECAQLAEQAAAAQDPHGTRTRP